jgi:hypothetical protein
MTFNKLNKPLLSAVHDLASKLYAYKTVLVVVWVTLKNNKVTKSTPSAAVIALYCDD